MPFIEIYTKDWCGYSQRAKALLSAKNLVFDEIDVTHDALGEHEMIQRSGRSAVPQIFIDGLHVGGSDELAAIATSGELDLITREVESAHANAAKSPIHLSLGAVTN